ncbi:MULTISPECIES: LysR family transcriptional regulator [Bradyrhizobium]|jgi:DNA-binding transcriptional LysR family regulator|uniref:DNA-binding transcriptional regulator, LysR family n=2 Tax=Bradyrhizobium TaxID=374 RepID=A0ABY0PA14_9BRAD|nr:MULTISPECIES: LysR family transcriptional regulator [Bradyrhizobium]SDH80338.1 DNA-binding transcriptional regulator, LysR family [Bradyrhizobium ottawaense]SEE05338.1 DNA-binding transcriptional regulator, LysR family [Bradyrhizobium lablabi]
MDIRELRYFAAVFSERNLTAAAKRCFISQPSISAAITHLEAELGTTLFVRHKKGMSPTASAEQFHAAARRIIDEADAAKNLFRKPSTRHALTLGLMRTLDMPRTIALLKPLTGISDIALRLVGINEAADARIISKNILKPGEHFVPLWVERYVAALPPSHPLTLKERLRTSDLAGVAMIDRCHCEQSEFFGRAASSPRQPVAAIAESEDWAMALVAAGVGIAIVPEGVARGRADVAVREIDVDVKRQVGLAYSAARPLPEALQNFIAQLRPRRPKIRRAKTIGKARR